MTTTEDHHKRPLLQWLSAEVARATGRSYRIKWEALDVGSLREVQRLLRDLDQEGQAAVRRARLQPWRL